MQQTRYPRNCVPTTQRPSKFLIIHEQDIRYSLKAFKAQTNHGKNVPVTFTIRTNVIKKFT